MGIALVDRELRYVQVNRRLAEINGISAEAHVGRSVSEVVPALPEHVLASARRAFEETFAPRTRSWHLYQVYDIAHNMGKLETHEIDGRPVRVCVHRKGATRAFGPGSPGLPAEYRKIGQPVIIPGSMGTASYVLVGTEKAMEETFGTVCHGAGRAKSRTAAKKGRDARVETQKLADQGILIRAETRDGILEEVPDAYKDIDAVINVVHNAGLARKVARLRPMGVIKG